MWIVCGTYVECKWNDGRVANNLLMSVYILCGLYVERMWNANGSMAGL